MIAAGILAKKATAKGLHTKPWVKTSLAPGSKVVTDYLTDSELLPELEKLRFHVVGYGCTTCIGNSGPLPDAIIEGDRLPWRWSSSAVLSGNRNFEGRVHGDVRANYLASPPLVVAYALAGKIDIDWDAEPVGQDAGGHDVFLKDIWPTQAEVHEVLEKSHQTGELRAHLRRASSKATPTGRACRCRRASSSRGTTSPPTSPTRPYFEGMGIAPPPLSEITGARVLALLGDSITTDHISPAGERSSKDSPAGAYLIAHGVQPTDFNQFGSRRGHHDVMMRGTFANVRFKNSCSCPVSKAVSRILAPAGRRTAEHLRRCRWQYRRRRVCQASRRDPGGQGIRQWAQAATGPRRAPTCSA